VHWEGPFTGVHIDDVSARTRFGSGLTLCVAVLGMVVISRGAEREKIEKLMDAPFSRSHNGPMRPRASRPDALQSVTVPEALEGLAAQHGSAGVPVQGA